MLPVETPFKTYTGIDGKPLQGGYVYFGEPNQNPITAPVEVYWDAAGTQPAAQPLRTANGYIVRRGTPANVFYSGSYSELVLDSKGRQVFYARTSDDFSIATVVLNYIASVAASAGASLIGFIQNLIGATARTLEDKNRDIVSSKDFGILNDYATTQTTQLAAKLTALGTGFRRMLHIPPGTKFDTPTVYAAVPLGTILCDTSGLNYGQYPGYKNKNIVYYSSDDVGDDTKFVVASNHHPTLLLNNHRTAGTGSAAIGNASLIFGLGMRWTNDPILGFQMVQSKSNSGDFLEINFVLNTSWVGATSTHWQANTAYALNTYVNTDAGHILQCTVAGTTDAVEPIISSAGTSVDGTVTWTWVSKWNQDSTRMYLDENGNGGVQGSTSAKWNLSSTTGRTSYFEADAGIIRWRDVTNNRDIAASSTARGIYLGGVPSLLPSSVSGATPAAITQLIDVVNAGATLMTNLTLPAGQTNALVYLRFADANTTIQHGGNFILRAAADTNYAANRVIQLIKYSGGSAAWVEL